MRLPPIAIAVAVAGLGLAAAAGSAAAQAFEVDLGTGAVTPAPSFGAPDCASRASDPRGYDLGLDWLVVHPRRGAAVRERLRRDGEGLMWILESDGALVVGTQLHRAHVARRYAGDRVVAIDQQTGRVLWRRALASTAAGNLSGGRVVVEVGGDLVVLAARTGKEVSRQASSPGLQHVCRGGAGLDVIKTSAHLTAFDAASGAVAWQAAATWTASPRVVGRQVVDVWLDAAHARWGLAAYRASDGALARSVDLGPSGPMDIVRFALEPRGADRVAVDATFAWE